MSAELETSPTGVPNTHDEAAATAADFSTQIKPGGLYHEYTPVDESTGLVLPILVKPEDFVVSESRRHHKEHPGPRAQLQGRAGKLLRYSVTQLIPDHMHWEKYRGSYHGIFMGPETLPTDRASQIHRGLVNLVVVPRIAIKLNGDGYDLIELSDDEHDFLSNPRITNIQGNSIAQRKRIGRAMGDSLIRFALDETLEGVISPRAEGKFLTTLDHQRERELANQFIYDAVDEAIRPALVTAEAATRDDMVSVRRLGIRATARGWLDESLLGNYYELLRQKLENPEAQVLPLRTETDELELQAA